MVAGSSVIANALIRRKESIGARCHQHCSGRVVEAALRCDLEAPLTAQQTAARRRELDAGPQLAFLRASAMPVTRSCSKPQRRRGLRRTFAHFLAKANISLLGCSSAGTTGLNVKRKALHATPAALGTVPAPVRPVTAVEVGSATGQGGVHPDAYALLPRSSPGPHQGTPQGTTPHIQQFTRATPLPYPPRHIVGRGEAYRARDNVTP